MFFLIYFFIIISKKRKNQQKFYFKFFDDKADVLKRLRQCKQFSINLFLVSYLITGVRHNDYLYRLKVYSIYPS